MNTRIWSGEANKARLAMAVCLVLLIGASGCTVPNGLPGPPGVPGGPATIYPTGAKIPDLSGRPITMTLEQRTTAAAAATDAWKPLRKGDPKADAAALLTVIAKTPGFADAGLSADGSVWARYQDGLPLNWILTADEQAEPAPPSARPSLVEPPAGQLRGIPDKDSAVQIDWRDNGRNAISAITPWLSKANYRTPEVGNRVDDMMPKVKDVGVHHLFSHGAVVPTLPGEMVYSLATTDVWWGRGPDVLDQSLSRLRENSELYRRELLTLSIIPGHFPLDNTYDAFVWSITQRFGDTYWTLSADALVFVDACSLYASDEGKTFAIHLMGVAANKSAVVLGWDSEVRVSFANTTAKKFFARILGNNSIDEDTPPRRPFTYQQVYDWMVSNDEVRDSFPGRGAILTLSGGDGQLVPSIIKANVIHPGKSASVPHAGERYLEIAGSFGPDPGSEHRSVKVGDTPLEVYSDGWSETVIQARMPQDAGSAGNYGNVVVEVRGHQSNPAPLTQWTGRVSQTEILQNTRGKGKVYISCPIRVTADLHFFRVTPKADLTTRFAAEILASGPCSYRLSGSWGWPGERYALSGNGFFSPEAGNVGNFVSFSRNGADLNANNRGTYPVFAHTVLNWLPGTMAGTQTRTSESGEYKTPVMVSFQALGTFWNNQRLNLDNTYSVPNRTRNCNWEGQFAACSETLELTPKGPIPDEDTPG